MEHTQDSVHAHGGSRCRQPARAACADAPYAHLHKERRRHINSTPAGNCIPLCAASPLHEEMAAHVRHLPAWCHINVACSRSQQTFFLLQGQHMQSAQQRGSAQDGQHSHQHGTEAPLTCGWQQAWRRRSSGGSRLFSSLWLSRLPASGLSPPAASAASSPAGSTCRALAAQLCTMRQAHVQSDCFRRPLTYIMPQSQL